MSPQEYAETQGFGLNTTVYQRFQIRGMTNQELLIYPTPGPEYNGDTLIFEYISDRSVRPRDWVGGTVFAAGSYCFYRGNYYYTTAGGTSGTPTVGPTHTSGTVGDGGIAWTYYDGPYSSFLADTDLSIFNEKLVEQGVLERFAQLHGLESVQPLFATQMHEEFGRTYAGKTIYAGGHARAQMFARNGTAVFGTWI
jgi:hypothetical protein